MAKKLAQANFWSVKMTKGATVTITVRTLLDLIPKVSFPNTDTQKKVEGKKRIKQKEEQEEHVSPLTYEIKFNLLLNDHHMVVNRDSFSIFL